MSDIHDYSSDHRYLAATERASKLASDRSNAMLGRNCYVQADDRNWNTEYRRALLDEGLDLFEVFRRDRTAPHWAPLPVPDRDDGWPEETCIAWVGDVWAARMAIYGEMPARVQYFDAEVRRVLGAAAVVSRNVDGEPAWIVDGHEYRVVDLLHTSPQAVARTLIERAGRTA